jgi:GAF domain-containing protein
MCWGIIFIALLYLPSLPFNGMGEQLNRQFAFSVVAVVAGMGLVLYLLNRGSLLGASVTYVALMYLATVAVILRYLPSPNGANLISVSVPLIAAGVLLTRRGIAAMLALIILTILALRLVSIFGLPTGVVLMPPTATEELWLNLIFLLADGVMLAVFTGGQRTILQRNLRLLRDLRNSAVISQSLVNIASVDELLAHAMDMIRDQFGYFYVQIFLVEPATGLLALHSGTSIAYSQDETGRRRITQNDPSVINEVVRTRQTIRVSINDPAERRSEFLSATQSELLVPLGREGDIQGVLDVHSIEANVFSTSEIEILETLAAQIASALENARMVDTLKATVRERSALAVQLRAATSEVEHLSREASGQGWNRYIQSRGPTGIGFDWKNGALTPSSATSPALQQALSSSMPEINVENGEQVLSVPIVLRGQILGAMEFRAPGEQAWNDRSLELARVIAQRLALALDNIRLYEQAQTIANREHTANQVAARLQTKTDIDSLVTAAAETFQQALGATRTTIRLGAPRTNGDHS